MTTSAYSCGPMYIGDSCDMTAEAIQLTTACTIHSTAARIPYGIRGILFPQNTAGTNGLRCFASAIVASDLRTKIAFFTGYFGASGQPDADQLDLVADSTSNPTARNIRIGNTGASDTKVRVYDGGGTLRGTSNASVSTTGTTKIMVCVDCLSLPTVFVQVYINSVLDTAFDTGVTPANFWTTGNALLWGSIITAGNERGADLYGKGFTARYTTNAALAPHLAGFPDLNGFGGAQFPAGIEGNYIQWTDNGTTPHPSPDTWKDIAATADFLSPGTVPGHDVDVTRLVAASNNLIHTFRWGNGGAFTQPITDTLIDSMYPLCVGKLVAGGKTDTHLFLRLGGVDLTVTRPTAPSTAYTSIWGPVGFDCDRPGGGAWTLTDLGLRVDNYSDLEYGLISLSSGTVSVVVTEIPGPIFSTYTNLLPLGALPYRPESWLSISNQPIFLRTGVVAY